jgi:hypothetical protein
MLALGACRDETNLLTAGEPHDVLTFEVLDQEGKSLWRIEAIDGAISVPRIDYGVVPSGFRQTVPENAKPPTPFSDGEELRMRVTMTDRILDHQGFATGPRSFLGGHWRTTPKQDR